MRFVTIILVAALVGCVGKPPAVAVAAPPPSSSADVAPPPAPTPINAGLSPAATLWHLRAGLNVAALACRGPDEAVMVARYNALLARHLVTLKTAEAAYAAEYGAARPEGRARYDDAMTRLYNFFGQARGRADFCAAAAAMLAELEAAPELADAPARLAILDHAFAPPWIAVDPAVFGDPPVRLASR